jgi:hypothetical protein
MGTGTRLPFLMLTAILGNYAPQRSPGGRTGVPGKGPNKAKCPECGQLSDSKSGKLFWCEDCRIWFDSKGKIRKRAGS